MLLIKKYCNLNGRDGLGIAVQVAACAALARSLDSLARQNLHFNLGICGLGDAALGRHWWFQVLLLVSPALCMAETE